MKDGRQPGGAPLRVERPALAITVGDPCGVGPEVVLRTVAAPLVRAAARLIVVGDERNLRQTARRLKLRWPFVRVVTQAPTDRRWGRPILLDLHNVDESLLPGQISALAGRAAVEAIEQAVGLALGGVTDGIVTAPIHKEAISMAGCSEPGHTELLARLTGAPRVGMLFWTEDFSVALLSTHHALHEAIRRVRRRRVFEQLVFVDREWGRWLGRRPRIVVAALNPHASEGGRFGVEEARQLAPAVEQARAKGVLASGPASADSVFTRARDGEFDVVLALHHDQATIPVKFCYGGRAVNVTLGLPFVRTSVDHGTAMDIAGKGLANEESLVQAVLLAARLVCSPG